jgi:hypothetical protein
MDYPQGFFGSYHSQKPICGVLAVAIAAQVTYDVAHEACKRHLPKSRQRFGGKTYDCQRDKALRDLGCTVELVELKGSLLKVVEQLEAGSVYHLHYAKHVVTVCDGFVIDQGAKLHYLAWPKVKTTRIKSVRKIMKGW